VLSRQNSRMSHGRPLQSAISESAWRTETTTQMLLILSVRASKARGFAKSSTCRGLPFFGKKDLGNCRQQFMQRVTYPHAHFFTGSRSLCDTSASAKRHFGRAVFYSVRGCRMGSSNATSQRLGRPFSQKTPCPPAPPGPGNAGTARRPSKLPGIGAAEIPSPQFGLLQSRS
jgi:hypothetical protein